MCLIVHREKAGAHIPKSVIEHNLRSNPDGFGISWRSKNGIKTEKFAPGKAGAAAFVQLLKAIDREPVEYVAHFRKATHGRPCVELSHPFSYTDPVEGEVLVFHNGMVDIKTSGPMQSDTSVFVESVLAHLPSRWWVDPAILWLVESSVGWSRFVIMTKRETVWVASDGYLINGIRYSTTPEPTYQRPRASTTYPGWTNKGSGHWEYTGAKSAADSYATLVDQEEADELAAEETALGLPASPDGNTGLYQNGHHLTIVKVDYTDKAGDQSGLAICDTCRTQGEFYRIDGKLYAEVAHKEVALVPASF